MIELKDFVRDSLVQIVEGVAEARDPIAKLGGLVNPVGNTDQRNVRKGHEFNPMSGSTEFVEFDVAISVGETESKSSGVGLFVGPVGLGAKSDGEESNSSTTKIKFAVPILFPKEAFQTQTYTQSNRVANG